MKLRIQGNLLRFRLTEKEVEAVRDGVPVECAIDFPSGRALCYSVTTADSEGVSADYVGDSILVTLPRELTQTWGGSNQVNIEGVSSSGIQILVEKDFPCLHKSKDPDVATRPKQLAAKEMLRET